MLDAQARCEYCSWTTIVNADSVAQLRNRVYAAVNRHVCHEPIPGSCEVKWGDHRCTVAPYDHVHHLCRCGDHSDGEVAP